MRNRTCKNCNLKSKEFYLTEHISGAWYCDNICLGEIERKIEETKEKRRRKRDKNISKQESNKLLELKKVVEVENNEISEEEILKEQPKINYRVVSEKEIEIVAEMVEARYPSNQNW